MWGGWGESQACDEYSAIYGMRVRILPQREGDNLGLTGVIFYCADKFASRGGSSSRTFRDRKTTNILRFLTSDDGYWSDILACDHPLFASSIRLVKSTNAHLGSHSREQAPKKTTK